MFVLYRLKIGARGVDKVCILVSGEQRKDPPPTAGVIEEFLYLNRKEIARGDPIF